MENRMTVSAIRIDLGMFGEKSIVLEIRRDLFCIKDDNHDQIHTVLYVNKPTGYVIEMSVSEKKPIYVVYKERVQGWLKKFKTLEEAMDDVAERYRSDVSSKLKELMLLVSVSGDVDEC